MTDEHITNGQRVKAARKAKGLTQVRLAELAGCKQADIYRIESDEIKNSKYLNAILAILDLSTTERAMIPVVGYIGAGAEVLAIDDHVKGDGFEHVEAPPGMLNGIALIVRGNSMAPVYKDGYTIFIEKTLSSIDGLIGDDCYVQLSDGRYFLKTLHYGTKPGTFTLLSYNAAPIENVIIERAYPIAYIKPRKRK